MMAGLGDFDARIFPLVYLLLHEFVPSVESACWRINENRTGGLEDSAEAARGSPSGSLGPDCDLQTRESSASETLITPTLSGLNSRSESKVSVAEGNRNPFDNASISAMEKTDVTTPQNIYQHEDGGRQVGNQERDDANARTAYDFPPAFWTGAKAVLNARVDDELRSMPRNASGNVVKEEFGGNAEEGDHGEEGRDGSFNSGRKPSESANQNSSGRQPYYEASLPAMEFTHESEIAVRSAGNKEASLGGSDTPTARGDSIVFPEEPEQYEEGEGDDGSSVETYFFIRAPLRNQTRTKCGPNQRYFRGRCRTYHP